jgi:transcriptional regulator with XRE-family HTH domain
MSALNENIRKFRELRKLTQKQFAERLNKSRNVISNWERGENSPDPDTVEQICKILEVTPNQIFGWEPCPDYERYLEKMNAIKSKIDALSRKKSEIESELEKARQLLKDETATEE